MKRLVPAVLAIAIATSCGEDRPASDEWVAEWEREQALIPTADELLEGGRDLCDELLGQYRDAMDRLRPTPSAEIDDAVQDWADLAESLVFECPTVPAEVDDRLAGLDVLAAEIDAGIEADSG